jgi:hypothetical protein
MRAGAESYLGNRCLIAGALKELLGPAAGPTSAGISNPVVGAVS